MSTVRSVLDIKIDEFEKKIQLALELLYIIKTPTPTLLSDPISYAWSILGYQEEIKLSEQQETILGNAISTLESLNLVFSRKEAVQLSYAMIKAYDLLITGSLKQNEASIHEAIFLLDSFKIPGFQIKQKVIKTLLNLNYVGLRSDEQSAELAKCGFLNYALKNNALGIAVLLIKAGANPNGNFQKSNIPFLFYVTMHPRLMHHTNGSLGFLQSKSTLIPYLSMRQLIRTFLENDFNLKTTFENKNLVEILMPAKSQEIPYPVFIIIKTLSEFYDKNIINKHDFRYVCLSLSKNGYLKLFPDMMKRSGFKYPDITENQKLSEEDFYTLKYLVSALIAFSGYQWQRIADSFLSQIGVTEKKDDLHKLRTTLIHFECLYLNAGHKNCWKNVRELIPELANIINQFDEIFNRERLPTSSIPKTAEDWSVFYKDHGIEMDAILNFSNPNAKNYNFRKNF